MDVRNIPVDLICLPPRLHRRALDPARLRELADSIRDTGLINPVTVERAGDHYLLRAGHRRLEAHRMLKCPMIPAHIYTPDPAAPGDRITWAENLDRDDISPVEQAEALADLRDATAMSIHAIAKHLHRSPDWVKERLELLDAPDALQDLVHSRELPMSHARELARVTDEHHRHTLTRYAILSGASYPVIKDWVAQWRLHRDDSQPGQAPLPPEPMPGQHYQVLMPCATCAQPHPVIELRIVRICSDCLQNVLAATAEWRAPNDRSTPIEPTRDANGEVIPLAAFPGYEP